ncbi:addiction module protein [uncultured Aquimarina sp.]|uniref:addiction module protein n=1 Tax=uncultured Aquimarina sp. TaxID=575652 RepID=UPI00262922D4|nr:addiction module protein [uncultured Aquimarina sp.]
MNINMNVMDLQADIEWILEELKDVKDPTLIEAFKNMLKYRRKVSESSYEISDEHKNILDQRLADHKANPNSGRSWREVKSDLQSKHRI